jgi:integrase
MSGSPVTVSEWMRSWMALQEVAVRPNTLKGYRTDTRWIGRGCGGVPLDQLRPEHVEAVYRMMLDAGLGAGSIVHVRRTLSAALNTAAGRGLLVGNPVKRAVTPRWAPPEVTPMTATQARKVLDAARGHRNPARWSVALALGLRQGEALGLRWGDVDLDTGTIRVRVQLQRAQWRHGCAPRDREPVCGHRADRCPARSGGGQQLVDVKSAAGRRTLRMPGPLVALLREQHADQAVQRAAAGERWRDWGLVFTQTDGRPLDQKRDWLAWKALLARAGVADARLHDARHTAATLLLVQGVADVVAMAVLGHTDLRVTRRYQHVADDLLQDAADRIGAALWDASEAIASNDRPAP